MLLLPQGGSTGASLSHRCLMPSRWLHTYKRSCASSERKTRYLLCESLNWLMSRSLLNIAKRSLLRLMLSCVGLASKHAAG